MKSKIKTEQCTNESGSVIERLTKSVVKAINTHVENASVCEAGCSALWNMTANNSKNIDKLKTNR